MHPAEHRGLRELYAMTRQLRDHWRALAARLDSRAADPAQLLREGSDTARTLLAELEDVTAARGVYGRPLAQGLGTQLATLHGALIDTALEVNQALRIAVLDVVHVVTLLDFLAGVSAKNADPDLQVFLEHWSAQMRVQEDAIRVAVIALADDPDLSVRPSTPGCAGRIGHGTANALGTLGEWVDRRAGR